VNHLSGRASLILAMMSLSEPRDPVPPELVERRLKHYFPTGGGVWMQPRGLDVPALFCSRCGKRHTGLARAGLPCVSCDGTVVDLDVEIGKLASSYDPATWIVAGIQNGMDGLA
jgi:hypothetical protein